MKKNKILSVIEKLLLFIAAAAFILIIIAKMFMPYIMVAGFSVFRIQTPSMQPELMVGDVILVKETPVEELKSGMTISYMSESGETNGMVITHKLVADPLPKAEGGYLLITKGILEGAVEDAPITEKQVIGKVIGKLHVMTFIYSLFSTKVGLLLLVVPLLLIILSEIKSIAKVFRGKENDDEE